MLLIHLDFRQLLGLALYMIFHAHSSNDLRFMCTVQYVSWKCLAADQANVKERERFPTKNWKGSESMAKVTKPAVTIDEEKTPSDSSHLSVCAPSAVSNLVLLYLGIQLYGNFNHSSASVQSTPTLIVDCTDAHFCSCSISHTLVGIQLSHLGFGTFPRRPFQ